MSNNNDVVILNLDRPREVRFGHRAIKLLCAMMKKSFEDMPTLIINAGPDDIEKIMYCGLMTDAKNHGETLELKDMEDLLDKAEYHKITDAMTQALNVAFGAKEEEEEKNFLGIALKKKK